MKKVIFAALIFILQCFYCRAQELFVFTEPASNMPAGSVSARLGNYLMQEKDTSKFDYRLIPEIMVGINKNFMLHGDAFFRNTSKNFSFAGGSIYAKYRFVSIDAIHNHFRMAAYARYSFNNNAIKAEDIDMYGQNSGYLAGVVATQLLHKVSLSENAAFIHATNNSNNKFPAGFSQSAINYSFSFGKLLLPKNYINFKQTNINLMLEILGQTISRTGKSYLDVAPSLQFIFNSQARVDVGFRKQLISSMQRTIANSAVLRFEYLFFNAMQ